MATVASRRGVEQVQEQGRYFKKAEVQELVERTNALVAETSWKAWLDNSLYFGDRCGCHRYEPWGPSFFFIGGGGGGGGGDDVMARVVLAIVGLVCVVFGLAVVNQFGLPCLDARKLMERVDTDRKEAENEVGAIEKNARDDQQVTARKFYTDLAGLLRAYNAFNQVNYAKYRESLIAGALVVAGGLSLAAGAIFAWPGVVVAGGVILLAAAVFGIGAAIYHAADERKKQAICVEMRQKGADVQQYIGQLTPNDEIPSYYAPHQRMACLWSERSAHNDIQARMRLAAARA